MNLESLKTKLILEYAFNKDNACTGSGLGGNFLYCAFCQTKGMKISDNVQDIQIVENDIVFNPIFIQSDLKTIRTKLDAVVADAIEREKFTFPSVEEFKQIVSEKSYKEYLLDKELPNIKELSLVDRFLLCFGLTNAFGSGLEENKDNNLFMKKFVDLIFLFDKSIILTAIRNFVGIDNIIRYQLDENEYFSKITKAFIA